MINESIGRSILSMMAELRFRDLGAAVMSVAILMSANAWSQNTTPSLTSSANQRRDELAKVREMLADPDPAMRLASMDTIAKSGDTTLIQYALRLAFAGDDANLRSAALRAYLATTKQLTFAILLPTALKTEYEQAMADKTKLPAFSQKYQNIMAYSSLGFRTSLTIIDYEFSHNTGTWKDPATSYDRQKYSFTVSGDHISGAALASLGTAGTHECIYEFATTRDLKLAGVMSCRNFGNVAPPVGLVAPLF